MARDFEKLALLIATHVDNLQRLAEGWSDDLIDLYEDTEAKAYLLIDDAMAVLDEQSGVPNAEKIRRLTALKREIAALRQLCYREMEDELEKRIVELQKNEEKFNIAWILLLYTGASRKPQVEQLTNRTSDAIRKYGVYNGDTVSEIIGRMQAADDERVYKALVQGITLRQGRKQIRERLKKAFGTSKRQIQVNTNLIVNGVSNDTAVAVYERNKKSLSGVLWVTALDDRVCEECAMYEGEVFVEGEEPGCPVHPNCRCHLIPVTLELEQDIMEQLKS